MPRYNGTAAAISWRMLCSILQSDGSARSGRRRQRDFPEHGPLGHAAVPMRRPGISGEKMIAALRRRLGPASRRFVPRRRGQHDDVSAALAEHGRGHDDVLVNAQARPPQGFLRGVVMGQRFEKIAAHHPEHVDLALRRAVDHFGRRPSGRPRHRKPPQALPPGCRLRADVRHATHLGAALHARMPANRHEAAIFAGREPSCEADVDERADGIDAVRMLGQSHRPDEDRVGRDIKRRANASMRARGAPTPARFVPTGGRARLRARRRSRECRRRRTRDRRRRARRAPAERR